MSGFSFRRHTWHRFLFIACLIAFGATEIRADFVVTSASRGVAAAATGGIGDDHSTAATGSYDRFAFSFGSSPAGIVSSIATHSSSVPSSTGPKISGIGTTSASASATGAPGFSNLADSFFDVYFNVSSTGTYKLDAIVDWGGPAPPYGGWASVELKDLTNSVTLGGISRNPSAPGLSVLSTSYLLSTGVNYRLLAGARVDGGFATAGSYSGHGNWNFVLVPEPSSVVLMSFGLLALGWWTRRRLSR